MNNEISAQELKRWMDAKKEFLLLDVREEEEYEEFNISGMLLPLGNLLAGITKLEDWKNKTVVVHCQGGKRGKAACVVLQKQGFNEVFHLEGGLQSWIQEFGK